MTKEYNDLKNEEVENVKGKDKNIRRGMKRICIVLNPLKCHSKF